MTLFFSSFFYIFMKKKKERREQTCLGSSIERLGWPTAMICSGRHSLSLAAVMLAFLCRLPLARATSSCTNTSFSSSVCNTSLPSSSHCVSDRRAITTSMTSNVPNGLPTARNVLGGALELCCNSPRTGFYRDGFCNTGDQDVGVHTVCARVTQAFLEYSRSQGNDLMFAAPQYGFPGLRDGDGWCLCAARWLEATRAGFPCPVVLAATHEKTLEIVSLELLQEHAIDRESVDA